MEVGPSVQWTLRRTRLPERDLWKQACKVPRQVTPRKVKNITRNELGE